MSLSWSAVLDALLRTIEQHSVRADLERVCVVRDLAGRIRMAIQPRAAARPDKAAFLDSVRAALGAWFAEMVWVDGQGIEERRLATNVLERYRSWPSSWPSDWDNGLGQRQSLSTIWSGEQRMRSKETWLRGDKVDPVWPRVPQAPAVVSFYSFKGGVGRTTTMAIVAKRLAALGWNVAVLDLDLEAPGVARFFNAPTDRGILDLLVEYGATGKIDDADLPLHRIEIQDSPREGRIDVYPVGAMDWSYLERLGALDYTPRSGRSESTIASAMRSLLRLLRKGSPPDYIFIDSRAGLHDLGGLSLHALAHVDVLIGRAGRATRDGFELALTALARRRKQEDLRLVMVQTFLPTVGELQRQSSEAWAIDLHDMFSRIVYPTLFADGEVSPGVMDPTAIHYPWPIPQYDNIAQADSLDSIDGSVLNAEPFTALCTRIVEQCGRSLTRSESEEDDGEDG